MATSLCQSPGAPRCPKERTGRPPQVARPRWPVPGGPPQVAHPRRPVPGGPPQVARLRWPVPGGPPQVALAAVTKTARSGRLTQDRSVFLPVLENGSPRSGRRRGRVLVRASSRWQTAGSPLRPHLAESGGEAGSLGGSCEGSDPIPGAPPRPRLIPVTSRRPDLRYVPSRGGGRGLSP